MSSTILHPEVGSSSSSSTFDSTHRSVVVSDDEIRLMVLYWRAANYLCVGQLYLQSNPLLHLPLHADHIKPRLLGHWGTCPGLNLIYVNLNRLLRLHSDFECIYLCGPGHGAPALIANVYLEGTYSEVYPKVSQDENGLRLLFRQFSSPGGIPSHASPQTPGSIHEGGELGYVLSHAFGAVFDQPNLIALAVVGDGEAETGPLEGSWKGITFLNPIHDGAVLPVLHLNGYKISGPTVLARESNDTLGSLFSGYGYQVYFVEGDDPHLVHRKMAETLDECYATIREIQRSARSSHIVTHRPRWPLIILRTPKGWTGPAFVDSKQVAGTFRAHQVPIGQVRENPEHLKLLEEWMKSYEPEKLFDRNGRLIPELQKLAPTGKHRMGVHPAANGCTDSKPLIIPDLTPYVVHLKSPGVVRCGSTMQLGEMLRDLYVANPSSFRIFCPDEINSNRVGAVFEVENRCLVSRVYENDEHVSTSGRVMEVLSEHNCEGWLEGYTLTGRHGLFVSYEAFALIVSSMASQHIKWLEVCLQIPWRSPIPSLNILLTSTCWRNDHNGFSHQGPGFIDTITSKQAIVSRVFLPPDANSLLVTADYCFRAKNCVNLIVIDKQPQLQYLTIDQAKLHFELGASEWKWASKMNESKSASARQQIPDIIMGCCGDTPTQETLAAVDWLHQHAPNFSIRVVNVLDLMCVYPPFDHPRGMTAENFRDLWTDDCDVIMAFHGYPSGFHPLLHHRPNPSRFHVRGYTEHGTTTTPFDMVVLNKMSRFHLAQEALKRTKNPPPNSQALQSLCDQMIRNHKEYIEDKLDDMPDITNWTWREEGEKNENRVRENEREKEEFVSTR